MNDFLSRQFEYRPKVAVVGDSILDEYYEVSSDRISPEFPVPVMRSLSGLPFKKSLGGAANVCAQFKNFNFDISLFSLINKEIQEIGSFIETDNCIFIDKIPIKRRFYSGKFPLYRLDIEPDNYGLNDYDLKENQKKIFNCLKSSFYDIVIFSDYNKGLFNNQRNLPLLINEDTITIVDPKKGPLDKWKGCSIIKPNSKEAFNLTGVVDWRSQCEIIMNKTNCQSVVITNEGLGVMGNVMGSFFEFYPEQTSEAMSVIGAGDCFVALLSMCMAHSIDIKKAVEIAFKACSSYVSHSFNIPLFPIDLEPSKIINENSLIKRDFSLAFTNGCFDILHPGHISLLEFAKSKAEKLVVAINSDESVKKQNKSHGLVNNLEIRKKMVSSLECVDYVVDFDEETPEKIIKTISPDFLIKGSDHPDPVGSNFVKKVFIFDLVDGYSTTSFIKKIKSMN